MSDAQPPAEEFPAKRWPFFVMAYVAAVLAIDALAAEGIEWPWDWGRLFTWSSYEIRDALTWAGVPSRMTEALGLRALGDFDCFKFLFWLALPLLVSLRRMDWGMLGKKRWKRIDIALLVGMAAAGVLAMMLIPRFPELRSTYPDLSGHPDAFKIAFVISKLLWIASWLPGWEFLHRYVLLRAATAKWPRSGWLLLPLFEGLYHLQKPTLEMAGMVLFSLAMTQWAMRRRNVLLPFLCHLIIEVELILFLLF